MPRKPRILGDGIGYHVILRCNNRERLLNPDEFPKLLLLLKEYKSKFSLRIYDYALMHSHVHLLLSTHNGHSLDIVMREFCLAFSKKYNYRNSRVGHFWRDRYWCRIVNDDRYALACLRYFSWNAVKAGLAPTPEKWPWSGCQYYMGLDNNELLDPHPTYLGLGSSPTVRQWNYSNLIKLPVDEREEQLFDERRRHGSKVFQASLERCVGHFFK